MKRGCLLRSVAYLIIVAAIFIYLFDKYGKPVYESSKKKITEVFLSELEDQFNSLTTESIPDSLKTVFSKKVEDMKLSEQFPDSTSISNLVNEIRNYIETHSDDLDNLSKLKEIIKDYEQRTKN